ncbi:SDR family oxidoreductase [Stieleria varia]|uniref:3-oxoacyl-[acyl-carrier-protein] reductase FabG n=1 Tax=Stieleria varia TaxID=2528005 RepID=A0A5C6AWN2_9BACT|nr:SDR family oxidoreductase [Stieleria varia]TWU04343.1 3-oxoacyl-[acyl-carrier-protein] reductase FabG [Stieleria varia]
MPQSLENKVVLVTGANRGIGRVIAETALQRGAAKVYAAVRTLSSAQPLVDQYGDRVVPIRADLNDPQSIVDAAASATDVDIVINNAGIIRPSELLSEGAIETLNDEINVNVSGLIRIAQAFAPNLKQQGGGVLVQLNSVASVRSFADFATYAASKAASYSITQALREKLADQGTQVISVHPGPIDTDMAGEAGLTEIAEPPSLVADGIFDAIQSGAFHVFPDSMARQVWEAYQGFAAAVIEPQDSATA